MSISSSRRVSLFSLQMAHFWPWSSDIKGERVLAFKKIALVKTSLRSVLTKVGGYRLRLRVVVGKVVMEKVVVMLLDLY
jgi:hypothetical protein